MRPWIFGVVILLCTHFVSWSQGLTDKVSVNFKDLPLELILDSISYKSGYQFSYNSDIMPSGSLFSLSRTDIHVDSLLSILLVGTQLEYEGKDDLIIIKKVKPAGDSNAKATQFGVSGWVRDAKTQEPLVGVNVHLNGTLIGTSTDKYGNYELRKIPPGSYELVFSYVGFDVVSHPLLIKDVVTQKVNALMQVKVQELDGVELVSTRFVDKNKWDKYYKEFTVEFLGKTQNANRCAIMNPQVLNFSYDKENDVLNAEASEALIIQNQALGYKIIYELLSFNKSPESTYENGKALFVNLEPDGRKEIKKWRYNRKKGFYGSANHFFICLIEGNYYRKGYRVYEINHPSEITSQNKTLINAKNLIRETKNPYEWVLKFDDMLMIEYTKEIESPQYVLEMNSNNEMSNVISSTLLDVTPNIQRSVIELRADSVLLDRFGQVKESRGMKMMGYWAWERVGDMMPAGYDPKGDKLTTR
ncbi:MAG: carboxypeptidase-like regulatory domain-containing protein [Cyclobacteriaceae bacterium]|nr:carboxypeptidase-like regulatory domain-containing protein [Cyclobacteriaceae bacterium SS2]